MPSIITHDTFGQDIYRDLFTLIGGSRDEAEAFLLGNQGPDPLFYSVACPWLRSNHDLGSVMHDQLPTRLLDAFKTGLPFLPESEQPIARAYALGFLCHYTLDSIAHPFIFSQQYQLCDAGEPGLTRSDGHEVHAFIETELDELVLYLKRNDTVETFNPARDVLKGSSHMLDVVSKLYVYVAMAVYGRAVPTDLFRSSVYAMRLGQRVFHSSSGLKREVLGRLEELVRPYSFCKAMSHRPVELETSIFDNRERACWEDPFSGGSSTESFWDLYERALAQAHHNIELFDEPGFDVEDARYITGDKNFSGKPTTAQIVSVE
ncbi:MAG TPA: peptidase [Candidatus Aphodovivens excrementavium]|nr:peptidase [Candidatus Aphodovivens excrementavium]